MGYDKGKGGGKQGPRFSTQPSQVKKPMKKKANTVTKGGAPGGRTSEMDKGLSKCDPNPHS